MICTLLLVLSTAALSSCTTTVGGALFVFGFRDLLLYIIVAIILALIIAFTARKERRRSAFWIGFVVSLLLSPLAGIVYLLIVFSRRRTDRQK